MRDTISGTAIGAIIGLVLVLLLKLGSPAEYTFVLGVSIIGTIVGAARRWFSR